MKVIDKKAIRQKGFKALKKSLGSAGAIRFIQEIYEGSGDYTKERKQWLENYSIEDIYKEIKEKRKK